MLKPQKTQLSHQNTAVSSVFADERLELSVVVHDLQLDSGGGRTFAHSVRDLAHFSSNNKVSPNKPPQLKSARQTRISVMDDPDELFNLNRRDELGHKSSWILPCIYALCMVIRMTGPHSSLPDAKTEFVSILAPGRSFYYMLIPVYLANTVLVTASFTSILRGTSIIQHGVSLFFPLVNICEYMWQWLLVKSNRVSDALTLVVINCVFSILLLVNVSHRRRQDLTKIWHSQAHTDQRLRDFWLVEVPCTLQACWSVLLVFMTANYVIVEDFIIRDEIIHNIRMLAGRQMAGAVGTIVLLACSTTCAVLSKEGGNSIVAFMAAWAGFDWAQSVARVPDVVKSPQLSWIEPTIDVPALRQGCLLIGLLSMMTLFVSMCLHGLRWTRIWKKRNQKDDYLFSSRNFPAFPTPSVSSGTTADYLTRQTSMKRRPSEFLMRSDSSMTEGDTPAVKKATAP